MIHLLPGDPATMILSGTDTTPKQIEELRRVGLDRPIYEQYVTWLSRVVYGDLGRSIYTRRPVAQSIVEQAGATLQLAFAALAFAVVGGIGLGTLAALGHRTWVDTLTMTIAALGISMPHFWLGLLLLFFFAFTLGWVPATGTEGLNRLVLPALTLGFTYAAVIARLVRSGLLEVIRRGLHPDGARQGPPGAPRDLGSRAQELAHSGRHARRAPSLATPWPTRSSSRPCSRGRASAVWPSRRFLKRTFPSHRV